MTCISKTLPKAFIVSNDTVNGKARIILNYDIECIVRKNKMFYQYETKTVEVNWRGSKEELEELVAENYDYYLSLPAI